MHNVVQKYKSVNRYLIQRKILTYIEINNKGGNT